MHLRTQKRIPFSLKAQLLLLLLQLLLWIMVTTPIELFSWLLLSRIFVASIWISLASSAAALVGLVFSLIRTSREIKITAGILFLLHAGIAFLTWYYVIGTLVGRS